MVVGAEGEEWVEHEEEWVEHEGEWVEQEGRGGCW